LSGLFWRASLDARLYASRPNSARPSPAEDFAFRQIGPAYVKIADGLASIDVSGRDPEWREVWAKLIETLTRAAL
jgi:hypothetical protein